MGLAFDRIANVDASTKRAPDISGGKRGAATVYLAAIKITPLSPLSGEIQNRADLDTPFELYETATASTDIRSDDILIVGGIEYPIQSVAKYFDREDVLVLTVQRLKE